MQKNPSRERKRIIYRFLKLVGKNFPITFPVLPYGWGNSQRHVLNRKGAKGKKSKYTSISIVHDDEWSWKVCTHLRDPNCSV